MAQLRSQKRNREAPRPRGRGLSFRQRGQHTVVPFRRKGHGTAETDVARVEAMG